MDKDVTFVAADHDLDGQIDTAYRTKYRRHSTSLIDYMVSPEARSATIRLVPGSRPA